MTRRLMAFSVCLTSFLFVAATSATADDIDATNVYQRINDADTNALTLARFTMGGPVPATDIVLDEQGESTGGRTNDAAMRPLFRQLNEAKLTAGIYPEFISLLDNYVVRSGQAETYTPAEQTEIDQFLDKAVLTAPMQIALAYINDELHQDLTAAQFRQAVETMWFEIYTNHFGGNATAGCSGFEHVFVGEGKYSAGGGTPRRGEISGYHGWLKFYRDEKASLVNYLGHKYDIPAARRPANPDVITLRMNWNYDPDAAGPEQPVELYKPKGGFFVGASPECELAMGTVAFYEHSEGLMTDDRRRAAINGSTYDMVLYSGVGTNSHADNHIRSFYPVLIGLSQPVDDPTTPTPMGDGAVVISRALPNPDGDDETGEWVEVKNQNDSDVDLTGWEIRDRQAGKLVLDGVLAAGATKRFDVTRTQHTLRMGNSGGQLRLYQGNELIDEVNYGGAMREQIFEFMH